MFTLEWDYFEDFFTFPLSDTTAAKSNQETAEDIAPSKRDVDEIVGEC